MLYVLFTVLGLIAAVLLFLVISGLLVSPKKYYTQDSGFYRCLIMIITTILMKVARVKFHVSGKEKLPKERKLLFVGNHLSNFDPMVTYFVFPEWKISYISKASILNMPIFGRYIRRCCFMDIDRENPRNAITTINQAAELLKNDTVSIGVYPEGTRSKSGDLLPFHNGVFKIAQKANVDIAVVALKGTNRISKNFPLRKTDVYIDVIEVIPAEKVDPKKTDIIGKQVETLLTEHNKRGD